MNVFHRYPALKSRDYMLQWIGQFISNAGTQMQTVAINWQLYEMTGSPYVLALLGASRIIPIILFSLVGGTIVDAHNRKKILYLTQISQALLAATQGVLTVMGLATPINLICINALLIAIYSLDGPARSAFMPSLVKRKHYGNAVSLNVIGYNISTVLGPAIAGFVIAYSGVAAVYFADAVSYLVLMATLFGIRAHGRIEGERKPASFSAMLEGLRFVRSKTLIWSTMLLDFFATFFAEATILLPVFAKDILHIGPELLGFLYAAPFIGATLMGFAAATIGKRINTGSVLLWSVVAYAAGMILFGVSTNYTMSLMALVIVGAGDGMSAVIRNIIRQLSTPDHIRGRMTAINQIFYTGGPRLGEVEAGILAGLVGAPVSVVIGGIGTLVAVGIMSVAIPALRRYKEE
ncbi:MAG: MFS transporter [Patescibacteria group bacterium]